MKREKLNVVFNKRAIDKKLDELKEDADLTASDIARAAMNIGIDYLVAERLGHGPQALKDCVIDNQDVQK